MKTLKNWVMILCVIGFTVIAYFVSSGSTFAFDRAMMEAVVSLRQNFLTLFFIPFTHTGDWQFVVLVCAILLMFQRTRRTFGYPMTISAIVSVSLYQILKFIFQRPRPAVLHLISQGGYSFPSGHSLTSLVFYGTLLLILYRKLVIEGESHPGDEGTANLVHGHEKRRDSHSAARNKKIFWVAFAVFSSYILLMGLSRIYLGVHYPTDVAASWFLGTCLLFWLAPLRKME